MEFRIKKYKKDYDYSYALGASPTVELLKNKSSMVVSVFFHSSYKLIDSEVYALCKNRNLPFEVNDRLFERLSQKENTYVIGVFKKYESRLDTGAHVVLVNPSDMGNLGTILRTALGFGFRNIAVIDPAADSFDPKTIRASMGARFYMNIAHFGSFDEYINEFPNQSIFSFMLDGKKELLELDIPEQQFSLVFGNEARGLDESFLNCGESVYIKHGGEIDSLNLSIAAGIAFHRFSRLNS